MIFAVALWHIWDNRNSCRNGEALPHPLRVFGQIKAYIDFILLNNVRSEGVGRCEALKLVKKWTPPPGGLMLINVDAAIFSSTSKAGYGVIMHTHLGVMQATCRGSVDHVQCPKVAEAVAIL